jgi:hypothetical protein
MLAFVRRVYQLPGYRNSGWHLYDDVRVGNEHLLRGVHTLCGRELPGLTAAKSPNRLEATYDEPAGLHGPLIKRESLCAGCRAKQDWIR